MLSVSHLTKSHKTALVLRTFCDLPNRKRIQELENQVNTVNKELEKIAGSIFLEALGIENKSLINESIRKEIENEQLKRIGKVALKVAAATGLALLCAAGGAMGFGYYIMSTATD